MSDTVFKLNRVDSRVGPIALEYQVSNPETRKFDVVLRARLLGLTRPGEDPLGNEPTSSLPAKP